MAITRRWRPALLAVAFAVFAPTAALGASGTVVHSSVRLGIAQPSRGSVGLPQPAAARTHMDKGARRMAPEVAAQAAIAPPSVPATAVTGLAGRLPANFDAVSSRDSAEANFGGQFEPPDETVCVGNGRVVNMVNSAYSIFATNGRRISGPLNVNGPFNLGLLEFTSDPRCYYDPQTGTFFATVVFVDDTFLAQSRIEVAVNASGDPTTPWTVYEIDATDNGGASGPRHPGCPCLGDQPTLGIDHDNLYVTTNEFSLAGPEFNGAQVYAIAKRQLVASEPAHFAQFDRLIEAGNAAFSVQPAITTDDPGAELFLSSTDANGDGAAQIGVWAMTNRANVALGRAPVLSSVLLPSEAYVQPPPAEQKRSASLIDAGDDRMQQTQSAGGAVWGALGTGVTVAHDATSRAGAAWFQVRPVITGTLIRSAAMVRQGYVGALGTSLLFPALAVERSGRAVMVLSLSSGARYPSAAFTALAPGAARFADVVVAAPGTGPYDAKAERWGDYSWAVTDPAGTSVWLATEYIAPLPRQTVDRKRNWGNRVLQVH